MAALIIIYGGCTLLYIISALLYRISLEEYLQIEFRPESGVH